MAYLSNNMYRRRHLGPLNPSAQDQRTFVCANQESCNGGLHFSIEIISTMMTTTSFALLCFARVVQDHKVFRAHITRSRPLILFGKYLFTLNVRSPMLSRAAHNGNASSGMLSGHLSDCTQNGGYHGHDLHRKNVIMERLTVNTGSLLGESGQRLHRKSWPMPCLKCT